MSQQVFAMPSASARSKGQALRFLNPQKASSRRRDRKDLWRQKQRQPSATSIGNFDSNRTIEAQSDLSKADSLVDDRPTHAGDDHELLSCQVQTSECESKITDCLQQWLDDDAYWEGLSDAERTFLWEDSFEYMSQNILRLRDPSYRTQYKLKSHEISIYDNVHFRLNARLIYNHASFKDYSIACEMFTAFTAWLQGRLGEYKKDLEELEGELDLGLELCQDALRGSDTQHV
ncbi:uncharacterized protein KY384_006609 [Bacidia gigantensis]|uniref:uncharacterized protein n=1 Tax=Bacidia gigantensis TaxID=2732470 RepID=UPI001D05076D|nr:uncharacterized protein KY384_006609 [Bacidia gigantensis]KAG8528920.1 hypothetical protein KY384_006609 [Bacidia gigantensis]